ncbi:SURF2 Surfeit locus protein 2 [Paraeggerthella hongkongensis]|uniref:SURF2 Surfeit locus protein 2 n=1 Tax=Paraeggerthella TaxID=651554 RepID=UPI001C0F8367|nr:MULTISPECIES: SURF2 Surfeit locus protein 2 [Paraeggerthella]MBU5406449.1 SURF2 Surfeit locus protein 2 [Paraeggerthella hongkongensis]MCD2434170.1 SURF2 Surfeit locus protein 2 [Paraeggerthella hominis]MDY3982074.1 SURF2 Surfeit locus protein 2 [Paraeggerthella sp.]
MASGDTKFSHITVNADDDDDFVIQAGLRPSAPAPEPAQTDGAVPSEPSFDAPSSTEDEREASAADDARPSSAGSKSSKKGYRETTAEDLEVEPMSAMQKIIIAVALLAIVGFIAYYVLFMR